MTFERDSINHQSNNFILLKVIDSLNAAKMAKYSLVMTDAM